jgi:hypothetical protein
MKDIIKRLYFISKCDMIKHFLFLPFGCSFLSTTLYAIDLGFTCAVIIRRWTRFLRTLWMFWNHSFHRKQRASRYNSHWCCPLPHGNVWSICVLRVAYANPLFPVSYFVLLEPDMQCRGLWVGRETWEEEWQEVAGQWLQLHCGRKGGWLTVTTTLL